MTGRDQTHQEVSVTTSDRSNFLLAPQHKLRIGAWNVRTMYEDGRTEQVLGEFRRLRLDILGISESRWIGEGEEIMENGEHVIYSGRPDNLHHQA